MRKSTCEKRPPKELYSLLLEVVSCSAQGQDRRNPSMVGPHPTNQRDPPPALSVVPTRPPPRVSTRTGQFNAPGTALPAPLVPTGLPQNQPHRTGTLPLRSYNICTCNRWLWCSIWLSSSMGAAWTWCRAPTWWQHTCSRCTWCSRWLAKIPAWCPIPQQQWSPWCPLMPSPWRNTIKISSNRPGKTPAISQAVMVKGCNSQVDGI